jgi:hypothetical protein
VCVCVCVCVCFCLFNCFESILNACGKFFVTPRAQHYRNINKNIHTETTTHTRTNTHTQTLTHTRKKTLNSHSHNMDTHPYRSCCQVVCDDKSAASHTHTHTLAHIHTHTYTHTHTVSAVKLCVTTRARCCFLPCVCVFVCKSTGMCVCVYVCVRLCLGVYPLIYSISHTHTHILVLSS